MENDRAGQVLKPMWWDPFLLQREQVSMRAGKGWSGIPPFLVQEGLKTANSLLSSSLALRTDTHSPAFSGVDPTPAKG